MLIRALIVLLLALNLGVGLWWLTQSPSIEAEPVAPPSGVLRLQLVGETPTAQAAADHLGGATTAPAAAPANAAPDQCVSFGPFTSAAAAARAREQASPMAIRVSVREASTGPFRAWKVSLPPYASAAEVESVDQQVAAAGFPDRFIVREGRDANSLALGRFAREDAARRHAAALVAAGFPARAEPIGTGPVSHWVDVIAGAGLDVERVRARIEAPEALDIDCAALP